MTLKTEHKIIIGLAALLILSIWLSTWTIFGQRHYIENLELLHRTDLQQDSIAIADYITKAKDAEDRYEDIRAQKLILVNRLASYHAKFKPTVVDGMSDAQLQEILIKKIEGNDI